MGNKYLGPTCATVTYTKCDKCWRLLSTHHDARYIQFDGGLFCTGCNAEKGLARQPVWEGLEHKELTLGFTITPEYQEQLRQAQQEHVDEAERRAQANEAFAWNVVIWTMVAICVAAAIVGARS